MENVPLHFALTGEVSNHTTNIFEKIGMSRHIQKKLLAFLINTIYKMHTSTAPILIPQTRDFWGCGVLPMTHTVIRWNERIPKHTRRITLGITFCGLIPPFYISWANAFTSMSRYQACMPATSLSPVAYEYNLNTRMKHDAPHGIASVRILDTQCTPQLDKPNLQTVWWIIQYGFDEDTRFLICIVERGEAYPIGRIAALLELFGYTFSMLGMPHTVHPRDYRLRLNADAITSDEMLW